MPAVSTYAPTGDAYLDGLLSGYKWGVSTLTFSFPSSASFYGSNYGVNEPGRNFGAFSTTQQNAVKAILPMFSAVAKIGFSQVTETASVHGDIRYAKTDAMATAYGYYPATAQIGGDLWFNNSSKQYETPVKGNYAWLTFMHETGHALGLKHPHEANGSFKAMPSDRDSVEYTVMSYKGYAGASATAGYTNGATSYPQSLMMLDIAALQKLYGANYATNAGDTVYRWDPNTGQMSLNGVGQGAPAGNKIFLTIWDGGGADTYDFSNYTTGLKVNLNPGSWTTTSTTQLASLGSNKVAVGNIANALLFNGSTASLIENIIGGSGADSLIGNAANNKITGGKGNDTVDGGTGTDTFIVSGTQANYAWVQLLDKSWTVTDLRVLNGDGIDTLKNMEFLQFSDRTVALTVGAAAAPVAQNDSYSTAKNTKLTVTPQGVLANDTDANGDKLTAVLVSNPSSGTLALKSDGSFVYTPANNFTGTVTFTYKDSDGKLSSNAATVTIKVGTTGAAAAPAGGSGQGEAGGAVAKDGWLGAHAPAETNGWLALMLGQKGLSAAERHGIADFLHDHPHIGLAGMPEHAGLHLYDFLLA